MFGSGVCFALQKLGLHQAFDVVVGVSTGALVGAYFLDDIEQGPEAVSLYYNECLDKRFINFTKWPMMDIDYIEERVVRGGRRKLDIEGILRHRSQFFAVATEWDTGEGHLINVKDARPGPIAALKASFAVTELYRRPVMVNGRNFTDGATALPFPIKKVLEDFDPTDVLVIANQTQAGISKRAPWAQKVLTNLAMTGLQPPVRAQVTRKFEQWKESLEHCRNSTANIGIIWGPDALGNLTCDPRRLRCAAQDGVSKTLATFGQSEIKFSLP